MTNQHRAAMQQAAELTRAGISPAVASSMATHDLKCLDRHMASPCAGPVEYRTTPDRSDGRAFPRCEAHFDLRMRSVERNLELQSPSPPAWFDPSYAGERWDED